MLPRKALAAVFALCFLSTSASALNSPRRLFLFRHSASAPAPTLSFVTTVSLDKSSATRTSSSANIGNPSYIGTRRVIVACGSDSNANGPLSSATINGVSATIHVDYEPATVANVRIFSAVVPSGTTGITITETFHGTQFGGDNCAIYNVNNSLLNSTTPTTGTGTAASATSVATSSIFTQPGGFILGAAVLSPASTGLAAPGYTTDAFGGAANLNFSLGNLAGGSLTPTASWGSSVTTSAIAAAAWR